MTPYGCRSTVPSWNRRSPASSPPTTATSRPAAASRCSTRRARRSCSARRASYDEIAVKAKDGVSDTALRAQLEKALPSDAVQTTTGTKLADDQARAIASSMSGLKQGLLVFAGIALFVGTFIIANTFTMLVAQRTKELALMRAVGASRRQVTRSVLIEAFVVGTVAAVDRTRRGCRHRRRAALADGHAGRAPCPTDRWSITPGTVATAFAVGILDHHARRLAARPPGREDPAGGGDEQRARRRRPPSRWCCATRWARCSRGPVSPWSSRPRRWTAPTARPPWASAPYCSIIGVFILTPLLSRPLIAAAAPVLRVFGVSGKLARQNSVRNPRRTAATASALMIGLTLITGMTVMAGSLQKSIDKMAASAIEADYMVSMANGARSSPDVEKKLKQADGVTATSPMRNAHGRIDGDGRVPDRRQRRHDRRADRARRWRGRLRGRRHRIVVDEDTAKSHGWKAGSDFTVTYEDGEKQRLTVAGVYEANELISGILIDNATLDPARVGRDRPADMQVMVKTADGTSDATKDRLEKALGTNPAIKVQDKQDLSNEIAKMFTLMLNMLYGLLAMAVIVAILGVINTLAMSVFERSQEIGMLRAIGLDRKGIKRMVRLESLVISLFGAVLGIGLGVFFGWAAGELLGVEHADVRTGPAVGPDGDLPAAGRGGGRPGGAVAGAPGGPAEHAARRSRRSSRAGGTRPRVAGGPVPGGTGPAAASALPGAGAQGQPGGAGPPGSARPGPG